MVLTKGPMNISYILSIFHFRALIWETRYCQSTVIVIDIIIPFIIMISTVKQIPLLIDNNNFETRFSWIELVKQRIVIFPVSYSFFVLNLWMEKKSASFIRYHHHYFVLFNIPIFVWYTNLRISESIYVLYTLISKWKWIRLNVIKSIESNHVSVYKIWRERYMY